MNQKITLFLLVCSLFFLGCTEKIESEEQLCSYLEFSPVCGVNGKTYINEKAAECAGVTVAHDGECSESSILDDSCENVDCPPGHLCQEGACIEITCTETDGGYDLPNKGTTSGIHGTKGTYETNEDYCINDTRIFEYTCMSEQLDPTGSKFTWTGYDCPPGHLCQEGACVQAPAASACKQAGESCSWDRYSRDHDCCEDLTCSNDICVTSRD
ncbi:MAG: Kazal-type serine protease inhibitor family protein [Candidatus Micrarchaeota archaeon]